MSSIAYVNKELIIALNTKIIFVNPDDLQIYKEIELPEDLSKHGLIIKASEPQNDEEPPKDKLEPVKIQHVKLSTDGQLLAVTTSGQKALILYSCRPENAKILSIRSIPRTSSAITFASDSKSLLVTDKTGDCYMFDAVDATAPGKTILGHLSIVYDVIFTPDQRHIITCDRDEKIRVTNYPDIFDIECYCLGHIEYVSKIALLPNNLDCLLSISGDKTLKLWKYQTGKKIAEVELPAPGIKFALRQVSPTVCHVAVLLYQPNECIIVYEIQQNDDGSFVFNTIDKHTIESNIVVDLCYVEDTLYLNVLDDNKLKIEIIGNTTNKSTTKWKTMVEDYFKDDDFQNPDDISLWFKKKFDNLTDYYQRKKRRMEEKK